MGQQYESLGSGRPQPAFDGQRDLGAFRTAPRPNPVDLYLDSLGSDHSRRAQVLVIRRICWLLSVPGRPENVSWGLLGQQHADLLTTRLQGLRYAKSTARSTLCVFRRLVELGGGQVQTLDLEARFDPSVAVDTSRLIRAARMMSDPWKAVRNEALVALVRDACLDERQVCSLDVGDVDLSQGKIEKLGLQLTAWGLVPVREWVTTWRPIVKCTRRRAKIDPSDRVQCSALLLSAPSGLSNARMIPSEVVRVMGMLSRRAARIA